MFANEDEETIVANYVVYDYRSGKVEYKREVEKIVEKEIKIRNYSEAWNNIKVIPKIEDSKPMRELATIFFYLLKKFSSLQEVEKKPDASMNFIFESGVSELCEKVVQEILFSHIKIENLEYIFDLLRNGILYLLKRL